MKILINLELIFIFSCYCNDENYELEKDRLEIEIKDKLWGSFNITNQNLAKREKLGNEELTYPLIYVTGSHGKGSTVKNLAGALTHAGYIAGAYTKPYPTTEERFQVNGIKTSSKELLKIYNILENADPFKLIAYTAHRRLTMLWMAYFSVKKVDVGVIEALLGGLYDDQNYISPMLSVITNHILEHPIVLGNTIRKIGLHKSGIIKYMAPVVLGHSINIQSLDIYSKQFLAPLTIVYPNKVNHTFDELNAKTASEACYLLKNNKFAKLTKYEIEEGMRGIKVFGRMDYIPLAIQKEFITLSKYPKAVLIDWGKNVPSFKILFRELKEKYPDCQIRMVLTQSKGRDYYGILDYLVKNVDYLHLFGCGWHDYECYENLVPIILTNQKYKEKWAELKSDLDPNAYEYFEATVEYAFKLSSQNQQPEIIFINQIMPFIYRVFNIETQFIL